MDQPPFERRAISPKVRHQDMGGLFRDAQGQVRSFWVLATFSAVAAASYFLLLGAISLLGLYPRALRLDEGRLFFTSSALLAAAALATVVCRAAFAAEAGFGRPRHLALGLGAGALAASAAALGGLFGELAQLEWGGAGAGAIALSGALQLLTVAPTSVGEEILLRGVALRQLARGTGPAAAVVLTGAAFGVMHATNPSASPVAAVNIALVGGWFGAMVWRTGSLWTGIGLHVAWNWVEGFVFGTPVSGLQPAASIWVVTPAREEFWSGGAFGPEAAGVTTLVLAAAIVATLLWRRAPKPLLLPPPPPPAA